MKIPPKDLPRHILMPCIGCGTIISVAPEAAKSIRGHLCSNCLAAVPGRQVAA